MVQTFCILNWIKKGYIDSSNGREYLTIPLNENKGDIKKNKETWNKIKYLIELENNDSGEQNYIYIKIRFNLDEKSPLKEELEMYNAVITIW